METFPAKLDKPGRKLTWVLKSFDDLSNAELYEILRLRSEVFVIEQQCFFQDMDNKDQLCKHLMGWSGEVLMAVSRIVPQGVSYPFPSIGRIAVSPLGRGKGYGGELLHESIQCVENVNGKTTIRIGAQLYLKNFYENFQFFQTSDVYLEDGIEHIEMTRSKPVE